ncbi:MAG TPA: nitroreductase family protein [Polyangiaceae bacterium]
MKLPHLEDFRLLLSRALPKSIGSTFTRKASSRPKPLAARSNDELLSLMRHEAHRIEKAVYNRILQRKLPEYRAKRERLAEIYRLLSDRSYPGDDPTLLWSKRIYDAFDHLEQDFIQAESRAPGEFNPNDADQFIEFLRNRRSARVWADEQPTEAELVAFAKRMIDAARWAPNSGNRQAWRFLILVRDEEKRLFEKIKEQHTVSAPLLIFCGMDRRVFGALGDDERSIFIDAGAAIMQMVLLAHHCNLGVCWNHFARDLIGSRPANQTQYRRFIESMAIPEHIEPIALVAIGRAKFLPPVPDRMKVDSLLLGEPILSNDDPADRRADRSKTALKG